MISIAEKSAWTFDTSATGGIGVEFVALPDEAARNVGRFIENELAVSGQAWKAS